MVHPVDVHVLLFYITLHPLAGLILLARRTRNVELLPSFDASLYHEYPLAIPAHVAPMPDYHYAHRRHGALQYSQW